jgi:hypothetical protein
MKISAERIAALFSLVLLTSTSALAQTPAPQPPADAQSCTPFAQDDSKPGGKGEPLGEKLAESKGVICPPKGHDSDIKVPPPDTGAKMPVIKPPADAK